MPDLPLTEFEKSLFEETEAPKQIKSFSEWSTQNDVADDDPQSFLSYADFMRESLGDSYDAKSEAEIQMGLRQGLSTISGMDGDTIEKTLAPKGADMQSKMNVVFSSLSGDDPDRQVILDYMAGEEVIAEQGDVTEEYKGKVASLMFEAEEIVERRFNETKEDLVNTNQLPFAYVMDEDGNQKLLISDTVSEMSLAKAVKASQLGDVSYENVSEIESQLRPIPDTGVSVYQFKKLSEISKSIEELSQDDAFVSEHIAGHARQLAREDDSAAESVSKTIGRGVSDLLAGIGVADDEVDARRKRVWLASHRSFDSAVEYITEQLNDSGANYKPSDVRDAYEALVVSSGFAGGSFALRQDATEAGQNLRNTKLGPQINPAVFVNDELFAKTLAAHPELSEETKKRFVEAQDEILADQFGNYNKVLEDSSYADEWSEALLAGRQEGKGDATILKEFTANEEVFSEVAARAKGIAASVWDAVSSLVYLAPTVFGSEWGKEGLVEMSKQQANRRQIASMFGAEYGVGQDVMEAIAPLIVDIGATFLLSTATAGAGGVAYVTAKSGAKLTATGMVKGITSNMLRATGDVALKKVADRAVKLNLIKEVAESGAGTAARKKTIEALEAYNSVVARKMGLAVGIFVPAASRSTAMSYGTIYTQLKESNPDLPEEDIHDRALGFAMTTGAVTGLITSAFSAIGRGGVEDALLKGMSFKEAKEVLEAVANTGAITNKAMSGAMKTVLADSLKKHSAQFLRTSGKIAKNAVDEGLEEGLDQLVSSFVEDVALNKDTPILERWQQTMHAAMVGGILGAGVPTVQAAARKLKVTPMDVADQSARLRGQFYQDVADNLTKNGSPTTANEVLRQIGERKRTKIQPPPLPTETTEEDQTILNDQAALSEVEQERTAEAQALEELENAEVRDEEQIATKQALLADLDNRIAELTDKTQPKAPVEIKLESAEDLVPDSVSGSQTTAGATLLERVADVSRAEVNFQFGNVKNKKAKKFSAQFVEASVLNTEHIGVVADKGSPLSLEQGKEAQAGIDIDFTDLQRTLATVKVGPNSENVLETLSQKVTTHNADYRSGDFTSSKSYARRKSSNKLEFDNVPVKEDLAPFVQKKVVESASLGYPVNLTTSDTHGIPIPEDVDPLALSDYVASSVYTIYPTVAVKKPVSGSSFESVSVRTRFNPQTGKTETGKVTGFVDEYGIGQFGNDPVVVAEMLRAKVPVFVPKGFSNVNPSILLDENNYVKDVVGLTADGAALESKVTPVEAPPKYYYNNAKTTILGSIPFKAVDLPTGVKKFDVENGATTEEDFSSVTEIKRSITSFSKELDKTGEERNVEAHSRMEPLTDPSDSDAQKQAMDAARQQFIFNARMFELKQDIIQDPTDKVGKLLNRMDLKVDAAASRLLPLISIDKAGEYSSSKILEVFIEQNVENNPALSGTAPPTFTSVLSKAADNFKAQKDYVSRKYRDVAALTLPQDGDLDTDSRRSDDYFSNFGREPDGTLAEPEVIANVMSSSIDNAIDAINKDQTLRRSVDEFVLNNVFDGSNEVAEVVKSLSPKDLFGVMSSWMVSSNGRVRKSVNSFVSGLESGSSRGIDLRNALIVSRFAGRPRGVSQINKPAVEEFQSLFAEITGDTIDSTEALNTMVAIDGALRTRLSVSLLSEAQRRGIAQANDVVIADLGLESGNSDSVVSALGKIAKSDKNPNHKLFAKLLLEDQAFIKNVKFVIGQGDTNIAGKYVKSIDGDHIVFINKATGNGRGLVNTLLEEYAHAVVSDTIAETGRPLNTTQKAAKKRLVTLFNKVNEAYDRQVSATGKRNPVIQVGLVNLDEFVAHFFLSPDFQSYVKTLTGPRTKVFDRTLNSMVSMFRGVNTNELNQYVKSFKDVLDLGKNTRRSTTTNAKALGSSVVNDALFSAPVEEDVQVEEEAPIEVQPEAFPEDFFDRLSPDQQSDAQSVKDFIRSLIPPSINIKTKIEGMGGSLAAVSKDESTIFINPIVLAAKVKNNSYLAARGIIGVSINEELAHTASFNGLTQAEVDAYVETLSDTDYLDILAEYTSNTKDESFAKEFHDGLKSEDPEVVLQTKRILAEEKLRMYLQKATRGYTTEEDTRFWKSNPSLLAILKRYFAAAIRRFAANRRPLGGAGGVALNKMINEMRAIQSGFVRQPNIKSFDVNNPDANFAFYASPEDKNIEDEILRAAPEGAIEHVYLREQEKFNQLREAGVIKVSQDIRQFAGLNVLLHQPDTAFAGEVTLDGDTIVTGKGGVYYPVQFSDQGYFWASTRSKAKEMEAALNQISAKNNGKILMALTSADVTKMFSSTTMAVGSINFFRKLTDNPRFYGLNKATLNKILVEAANEAEHTTNSGSVKKLFRRLKIKDGLDQNIRNLRELLGPDDSVFPVRKDFVSRLALGVSDTLSSPSKDKIKLMTEEDQKKEETKQIQAFRIASILAGSNDYVSKTLRDRKLSRPAILQGLGDMFTEPFIKTFQQLDRKTGNIYAVLEIDGEVEAVPAPEHESYPFTIVSKEKGVTPKINVLSKSYKWNEVSHDIDTDKPVPQSKLDSYFPPSSGVSNTSLKFVEPDEAAESNSLPLQFAAPSDPNPLQSDLNLNPVVDLLEMPMLEIGGKGPENRLLNWLNKLVTGEISEPFRRLIENRSFYRKAAEDNMTKFKRKMDRLIIETYGSYDNAPMDLIAKAQGYRSDSLVSEERLGLIDKAYDEKLDEIASRRSSGVITTDEAKAEREAAKEGKNNIIGKAYDEAVKIAEEERNKALRDLAAASPDLASFIIEIRQNHIIPIQKKLVEMGLNDDVSIKVSRTGEVYLTRAYRMFTDSNYLEMVKEDASYADVREAAMEFFEGQFISDTADKIKKDADENKKPMTYQEAKQLARRELDKLNLQNPHYSYGQQTLDAFLSQYDSKAKTKGQSPSGFKMMVDNFKKRSDLPKPIRDLLGEYGAETGTDLILRTYSTVANIAAQKSFLKQLKFYAGEKEGLLISAETKFATDENRKKYAGWESVRMGQTDGANDPMTDMYVHPEFKEALQQTLNNTYIQEYAGTSERLVNGAFTLASKLSGKAMAAKTLGSVGFYFRNALGNFIFGTSQGFFRYDQMFTSMGGASFKALFGKDGEIDPVVTEMIGLGVMGDELRAGVMRDLLNGKQNPDGIQKELEGLMEKSKLNKPKKVLAAIEKKAQDLSAALDAAYKAVYYQHELGYIERAAAQNPEGKFGQMSPMQRKREAARKVLMTAQSYSQAPPLITDITKSPLGLMFAPFLRFKAEMFRIPFNTYKLGLEEFRSGDPVMRQRGILRMSSMTFVLAGLSSAVPMIAAAMTGIGDDEHEDEAMRAGIPEYLRGHTFYYFTLGGKLTSFDATYLNPFAGTVDPVLRSMEKIRAGEYSEAGAAFALGYVKDQFLDTQILAGAAINAANNTNQSTGKPIWNKGVDDPIDVAYKLFEFIAGEAYAPRIGKDFVKGLETQSLSGMMGELSKGVAPARFHEVDLQRQYERYLLDHNKRFANVKSELGQLRRNVPMTEDTVRQIIDDNIEARRKMNYELMRITKGYNSLGIDSAKIGKTMKDLNVGKKRMQLLTYGYMDKPPTLNIIETLLKPQNKDYGIERAKQVVNYMQTQNRYIPVRPVTEPE